MLGERAEPDILGGLAVVIGGVEAPASTGGSDADPAGGPEWPHAVRCADLRAHWFGPDRRAEGSSMLATLCKPSVSVTTPNIRESDILYGLNPPGRVTREYCGS